MLSFRKSSTPSHSFLTIPKSAHFLIQQSQLIHPSGHLRIVRLQSLDLFILNPSQNEHRMILRFPEIHMQGGVGERGCVMFVKSECLGHNEMVFLPMSYSSLL